MGAGSSTLRAWERLLVMLELKSDEVKMAIQTCKISVIFVAFTVHCAVHLGGQEFDMIVWAALE